MIDRSSEQGQKEGVRERDTEKKEYTDRYRKKEQIERIRYIKIYKGGETDRERDSECESGTLKERYRDKQTDRQRDRLKKRGGLRKREREKKIFRLE